MTEPIKKDYYDLAYRMVIAIGVGLIPFFIMYPIISLIDCDSNELTTEEQLKCHTGSDQMIWISTWIVIPIFCIGMFSVAFTGVYHEWQRALNPEKETSAEKEFRLKWEIQDNEDRLIREKYDSMPDLVEKKK